VNRLKFRAEHAVLHTSQETCTALHGDSTWTVGDNTHLGITKHTVLVGKPHNVGKGLRKLCSGGPTGGHNGHLCRAL
jgi:hypothetical protein